MTVIQNVESAPGGASDDDQKDTDRGKGIKSAFIGVLRFLALLLLLYLFICSLTFLTSAFRLIAGRTAGTKVTENIFNIVL